MATLLLRLAGPMQSWGTQSRFSERDAGQEPSKSGVIGLVCSAMGRSRDEPVEDLANLRMGVRVDRSGAVRRDFQTAGGNHRKGDQYGVMSPGGKSRRTVLSNRYYLADASFLVGLEGNRTLLGIIDEALQRPKWQIFLGRKAFVPGEMIRLPEYPPLGPGLRDEPLLEVLSSYPWVYDPRRSGDEKPEQLQTIVDAPYGSTTYVRQDVPISFADRKFARRYINIDVVETVGIKCISLNSN